MLSSSRFFASAFFADDDGDELTGSDDSDGDDGNDDDVDGGDNDVPFLSRVPTLELHGDSHRVVSLQALLGNESSDIGLHMCSHRPQLPILLNNHYRSRPAPRQNQLHMLPEFGEHTRACI